MSTSKNRKPKIALTMAGGGPLGAMYEIGALCALEDSLHGLKLTELDHYVGVSSGSFMAAALANGITPRELCAMFITSDDVRQGGGGAASVPPDVFDPSILMRPAWGELARRAIMAPSVVAKAAWAFGVRGKSRSQSMEMLGAMLPTGILSNEAMHDVMESILTKPGRTNDFRRLHTRLTIVATHLDSGEAAPFGQKGMDDVPISKAVQASAALPGVFPPVEIRDAYFVDGALKKTMHATVALDEGIDLLLCLNPLVPFDATQPTASRVMLRGLPPERARIPGIVEGGLPAVLSQTFRTMIHSRMELGLKNYERSYPKTAIVLFEPNHRDAEMYLANTFSYSQRRHIAEHAYQSTRAFLRSNHTRCSTLLAKGGLSLNHDSLAEQRWLLSAQKAPTAIGRAVQSLQEVLDNVEAVAA